MSTEQRDFIQAFEIGDRVSKRRLLYDLGLNLSLNCKTLCLAIIPPFRAIKKIALLMRELSRVLEPVKGVDFARAYTDKLDGNPEWWAVQDSLPAAKPLC